MKAITSNKRSKTCAMARFRPETQRPVSRLPKASREALAEARDIIAHPEKYPGMTLQEFVQWAESL